MCADACLSGMGECEHLEWTIGQGLVPNKYSNYYKLLLHNINIMHVVCFVYMY